MANIEKEIVEITGVKDQEIPHVETMDEEIVDEISTSRDKRLERDKITREIVQQQMKEYKLAEKLVLNKIEKDFGVFIERNMKMEFENIKYEFDGIIRKGEKLTAIEVKYMRKKNAWNRSQWDNLSYKLNKLFDSFSEEQKNEFTLIFAVVTDEMQSEMYKFLQDRLNLEKFNIIIQVYDFDTLINEMMA
jgi:hypothetical protein